MPHRGCPTPLLIVIACLVVAGCAEVEPGAPARIVFGETTFDAGRVPQGAKIDHAFAFRNTGERELRISRIRATCECVAVTEADSAVPAGATADVAASLDTTGLFGPVTRTIAVFTNDPSSPAVLLKMSAEVVADVAAKPRLLYLGRVRPGDEVRMQGGILLGDGTEVAGIDAAGAVVAGRLVEPATGSVHERRRRFQIRIKDQAPPGPFTEEVTVHTTSRGTPVLTIPVSGVVEGET